MVIRTKRARLWLLPLGLMGLVTVALVLLFSLCRNVEIVAGKSLPALWIASKLEDNAYDVQIRLLNSIIQTGSVPRAEDKEGKAVQIILVSSSELLGAYAKTVVHDGDSRNYEQTVLALDAYRQEVVRCMDQSVKDDVRTLARRLSSRFDEYDQTLDRLRDFRHVRASERVATTLHTGEILLGGQLTLLGFALFGIGGIALFMLIRNMRDPNPNDF